MSRSEVIEWLGDDWIAVVDLIRSALRSDVQLLNMVNENVLSHSGKMLRPMLSILVARALGTPGPESFSCAAASELLHNATLMHDDVADKSSQRRGAPTVSAMLGPQAAVLVGDFWLSRAMDILLRSDRRLTIVPLFAQTLNDLAEGEMLQLEKATHCDTTEDDYYRIIYCKTASLFVAAMVSAAEAVNASEDLVAATRTYAEALGIAFQIKDDILDYAGDAQLGKPVGVDILEQKITLPLLGAMKCSGKEEQMRDLVRRVDGNGEEAEAVRRFVKEEKGIEYAAARLDEFILKAERALDAYPDSPAKRFLIDIARYNAFREV